MYEYTGRGTGDLSILVGDSFKPIVWQADYDMDFSSDCLFCHNEDLKGYQVVDEQGMSGKIAVCPSCLKVNARY
ncbi:MAG: hypothetical protein H0Z33_01640 [Bacillaceae bacterium]|nr:hypothetical protein [Bacillaceae bacterium]